ncbi:MAG: type IX secretion system sortase PorU [Candidatus Kapaibacterium sp.]
MDLVRRVLMIIAVVVGCSHHAVAASSTQTDVRVVRSTASELVLTYSGQATLDTIVGSSGAVVRPASPLARLVYNEGMGRYGRCYVRCYDVIVPSSTGFELQHAEFTTRTMVAATSRLEQVSNGTLRIKSAQRVWMTYDGIAGNRHVARLWVSVADETDEGLSIMTKATIRISFRAATANGHASSAPSSLLALNPEAPWFVHRGAFDRATSKSRSESVQAETPAVFYRFTITREGIYRITADQLKRAGIATDAAAAASIKVFGGGGLELSERVEAALSDQRREQPLTVETNPDGSIREIVFYASGTTGWRNTGDSIRHYINHYATEAGYYLSVGGGARERVKVRGASTQDPSIRPTLTTGRVFMEDEIVSPFSMGSGRRWLGRSIENRSSVSITTTLPGLVPTGTVQYRYVVGHRGNLSGTLTLSESGTTIGQVSLPDVPEYMDAYTSIGWGSIAASRIPVDGRSVVRLAYASSDNGSTGVIDWLEIHYPQSLDAQANSYTFWSLPGDGSTQEYSINGFSGSVYGFEVTDPSRPARVENAATVGGMFAVREQIGKGSLRRYFISGNLLSVGALSRVAMPDVLAPEREADVIVITHPDLLASAREFATYRQSQGRFTVSLTTTDEIYARYSYGMLDPTAIRDYIAQTYAKWPNRLTHVVLWGDGHFDYKNLSSQQKNFIIPYESLDPDNASIGLATFTTDDFYARISGEDRRPDIAIGRVPARSDADARAYINKVRSYESSASRDDWRTRITLVADDGTKENNLTDGSTHLDQNESLANFVVPKEFQQKKIYMVEYPTENVARGRRKPAVTQELLSTINTSGSLLLNYIGHGNPRVWAHEQIFVRETTPGDMLNVAKPFFLTAATCDFARYDMTDLQSGAEELLLKADGGAIGVFSAARVVFSSDNARLNNEFYGDLFTRLADGTYPTVGQTMYRVKQIYNNANDEKFLILGDPTMRLLVPDHHVRFTTLNGRDIDADTTPIKVEALSTVELSGIITSPMDSVSDVSFNGYVTISLTDAAPTVTVYDNDVSNSKNVFLRPGAALVKGSFKVVKGRFTATFVVPKDISFSQNLAALYGYAASDDKRYAMGVTRRVVVDGVYDVQDPETDGPDLQVYMDSRKFLPGGIVRKNPVLIIDLSDATGINTTGLGIGHEITAQFNNSNDVDILTPSFTTSLENPRAGTAQKQIFGLGAGMHTVTVRGWDVYNNMSQKSTMFRIPEDNGSIVGQGLYNFPNPFSTSTTIRFTHASQRPFSATLAIYDIHGARLIERPMQIIDMQTADVLWDGLDESGDAAQSGVYQVVVQLKDADGSVSHVSGKVTLIR